MGADNMALIGAASQPDGNYPGPWRLNNELAQVVQQLHSPEYEYARRGLIWTAMSPIAGVVIPIYSATAQLFVLWNQSSSTNLRLIQLTLAHIGTPSVSGNIGFAIIQAGFQIATGNISVFTKAVAPLIPINSKTLIGQEAPAGKFAGAATVVAPTVYLPIGLSSAGVLAAASTTTPWSILEKNFNGSFIVPPGMAIALCGNVAQTAAMAATLSWAEVPVTAGN